MSRIAICYLSGDLVHADFAGCLVDVVAKALQSQHRITRINTKCTIIADGRNDAVRAALSDNATHILFLDSDMTFPSDVVDRLLAHGRAVVGATYMSRRQHPDEQKHVLLHRELDGAPTVLGRGARQVAALPTGCLLIDAKVFTTMPQPWFYFGLNTTGHTVGEDYAFCTGATNAGVSLWLDADLSAQVGHITSVPLFPAMFGHMGA